jgi:hypothetical protein
VTTYYLDPAAGSDSNNGTTTGTPWLTATHANAQTLSPGDSLLLNRGTTLNANTQGQLLIAGSGSAGNVITVGAYGSGALPAVSGGTVVTGWTVQSGATYQATLTASTAPGIVWAANQRLTKASSLAAITTNQFWWASNVLYVNLGGTNPSTLTVTAATFNQPFRVTGGYITVQDILLAYGQYQSLAIDQTGNSGPVNVIGCTIQRTGDDTGTSGHPGSLNVLKGQSGGEITANTFQDNSNDNLYFGSQSGLGMRGWAIHDNSWVNRQGAAADHIQCNCQGLSGWDFASTIYNETFSSLGTDSAKGTIIFSDVNGGYGTNLRIHDCTIIGGNFGIEFAGASDSEFDHIVFDRIGNDPTSVGFGAATWYGAMYMSTNAPDNVKIHHNVYKNCFRAYSWIGGSGTTTMQVSNVDVHNDTVIDCVNAGAYLVVPVSGTFRNIIWSCSNVMSNAIVRQSGGIVSGQTLSFDYNDYYPQPNTTNNFHWSGTNYATLAAYKTATGQDAHSISADPLFVDRAGGDYHLQAGSPAVDAGTPITGESFPGSAPDLGAFEYVASTTTYRVLVNGSKVLLAYA